LGAYSTPPDLLAGFKRPYFVLLRGVRTKGGRRKGKGRVARGRGG